MSMMIIAAKKTTSTAIILHDTGYWANDRSSMDFAITRNAKEPILHEHTKKPHISCAIFVGLTVERLFAYCLLLTVLAIIAKIAAMTAVMAR